MGRPYRAELLEIAGAYEAAAGAEATSLDAAVSRASTGPTVVVGSGGSLSAATYLAQLHERHTGHVSRAMTPLELLDAGVLRNVSVWCLSASGRNPDIHAALRKAAEDEPRQLVALCLAADSPLSETARKYHFADVIEIRLPIGRDGFLATNSLIAMSTLAAASYARVFGSANLPRLYVDFVAQVIGAAPDMMFGAGQMRALERRVISVLHSIATKAAAVDLESRFVEAAIGGLHTSDWRNFAHGRHVWLANHRDETGIVALSGPETRDIADRTLALVPTDIPIARWDLSGPRDQQGLAGLILSLHIAGAAATARGLDPGRPHVPDFGRRIYHLKMRYSSKKRDALKKAAVARKMRASVDVATHLRDVAEWYAAYEAALELLKSTSFAGVVFDYDGTLVDVHSRFLPLSADITAQLTRIAAGGAKIGVVTGRGRSARQALQAALPEGCWPQVLVGYYNGAEIGVLDDETVPSAGEELGELKLVHSALRSDLILSGCAIEARPYQLSLTTDALTIADLWLRVKECLARASAPGVTVVRSSHSVDVLAPGVSKANVLERLSATAAHPSSFLCIGDRGRWPGNDFALLDHPYGLSVDEVSLDPKNCWNLAPAGWRGPQATIYYLDRIHFGGNGMQVVLP